MLSLVACSGQAYRAPVDSLEQPPSQKITTHVVASGDTLYSIAWRYGLDVRTLARVNRVSEPYLIFPGQRLNLDLSNVPASKPYPVAANPERRTRSFQRSNNRASSAPAPVKKATQESELNWQWPVDGTILSGFSGAMALNKGIDISAKKGEPVRAAEAGSVVYAGDGLRGYGNLLIIKHNRNYLSAYAHNNKLLVKEGEIVKAGQQIAEAGSSGTNKDKLHFEIRRDGKPVDPLRYLPTRNR